MVKVLLIGVWICASTLGSLYGVMVWKSGEQAKLKPYSLFSALEYVKTNTLSVPIISEGKVAGYVIARFAFLADKTELERISIPVEAVLADESFRTIYAGSLRDFQRLEKYDLAALTAKMRTNANKRLGSKIVKDVLVDMINYVPKNEVRFKGLKG